MKNEAREVGICPKLQVAYLGPFVVVKVHGILNFEIQMNSEGKTKMLHFDKLKRYEGINPPGWAVKVAKAVQKSNLSHGHKNTQTPEEALV